jgi:hypothetical protein
MSFDPAIYFQQYKMPLFYFIVGLSFVISRIPVVGRFFRVINTLVHESGHAMMAMVTNGQVVSVDLNADTSGLAKTKTKGKFQSMLTSLAGYPCASLTGFLLFYFIYKNDYGWVLYILLTFSLINLLFWVRNAFGVFWILLFSALVLFVYLKSAPVYVFAISVFCASVLVLESVYSSAIVFYFAFADSKNAGDAKNLKDITSVPAFFWGLIFFAQSLYFAYLSIKLFVPAINNMI